jgi:hypothetical protein
MMSSTTTTAAMPGGTHTVSASVSASSVPVFGAAGSGSGSGSAAGSGSARLAAPAVTPEARVQRSRDERIGAAAPRRGRSHHPQM